MGDLKMKSVLAIVFWSVLLGVGSQSTDPSISASGSEDRASYFRDAVSYTSCINTGECDPDEDYNAIHDIVTEGNDEHDLGNDHAVYEPEDGIVHEPDFEPHVDKEYDPYDDEHLPEEFEPFDHEEIPLDEPHCYEETAGFPYFKFCERVSSKFVELESRHPELGSLKLEFLKALETRTANLDVDCKEGESVISKLLDLVIDVAEEMKVKFSKDTHEIYEQVEEIIAEDDLEEHQVGSVRGIPGINYPNYTEVPITSFSCSNQKYIPGFYADLETGCQVFHVCYEHRRESFLCPIGTIFNQPILACDYWYNGDCSQAPNNYDVNEKKDDFKVSDEDDIDDFITTIIEEKPDLPEMPVKPIEPSIKKNIFKDLVKFMPVKAKIFEYPKAPKDKVSVSTFGKGEVASNLFGVVHKPKKVYVPKKPAVVAPKKMKPLPLVKPRFRVKSLPLTKVAYAPYKSIPAAKAKIAVATVPVAKKIAIKPAVPVVKAKLLKAIVPVVKAKAVPVAKLVKAAVPVIKAKVVSAATSPVVAKKTKKFVNLAATANVKPKLIPKVSRIPVVKAKTAKAASISPLTKKVLARGYMKLLRAKKVAVKG